MPWPESQPQDVWERALAKARESHRSFRRTYYSQAHYQEFFAGNLDWLSLRRREIEDWFTDYEQNAQHGKHIVTPDEETFLSKQRGLVLSAEEARLNAGVSPQALWEERQAALGYTCSWNPRELQRTGSSWYLKDRTAKINEMWRNFQISTTESILLQNQIGATFFYSVNTFERHAQPQNLEPPIPETQPLPQKHTEVHSTPPKPREIQLSESSYGTHDGSRSTTHYEIKDEVSGERLKLIRFTGRDSSGRLYERFNVRGSTQLIHFLAPVGGINELIDRIKRSGKMLG